MLLGPDGTVQPPQEIVQRLQRIDPNLGVRWMPCGPDHSYWAVTMTWAPGDPRYQRIFDGNLSPDQNFDMVCQLPIDCDVHDAYAYFCNAVRASKREDVQYLIHRTHLWNREHHDRLWDPVMDEAMAYVETHARTLFPHKGVIAFSAGGLEKPTEPEAPPS